MTLGSRFRLPRVCRYLGLFVEVAVLVAVLIRVKKRGFEPLLFVLYSS